MTDREKVEKHLGRKLKWYEELRYIDDCPWNNDLQNLAIQFAAINYRHGPPAKPAPEVTCRVCGKLLVKRANGSIPKTCSRACNGLWQSAMQRRPEAAKSLYNSKAARCKKLNRVDLPENLKSISKGDR